MKPIVLANHHFPNSIGQLVRKVKRMKKHLGAAIVGAVMMFSGAAYANDHHGVGDFPMPNHDDHFPSFEFYYHNDHHSDGGNHDGGNHDDGGSVGDPNPNTNGGNDYVPPDQNCGDDHHNYGDGCHHTPPPCGDPQVTVVPLPQSSALAGAGLLGTVLIGWVRSRRAVRA
jgi:hypothetical protein